MNAEICVEWLRRQGHKVVKTESSYWYDIGPRIYQAFPYHKIISPSLEEFQYLFRKIGSIAIRYSKPYTQPGGQISYHTVLERDSYELSRFSKKVRYAIIHGLQHASYEPIPLSRLADEGWNLRADTLLRQGRPKAETKTFWENLCKTAFDLPSVEAWGALHNGSLIAALLACTNGDTVSILYQQSLSHHLKHGINNALVFVFANEVFKRPGVQRIFYGLHSLDAPSSVDEFKVRMHFWTKPVRQHVIFNPLVSPLIQPISHQMLLFLQRLFPENYAIAKAEGMIRFYLQGKQPLVEQEWPLLLLEQKDEILSQISMTGDLFTLHQEKKNE